MAEDGMVAVLGKVWERMPKQPVILPNVIDFRLFLQGPSGTSGGASVKVSFQT